MSSSFYRQYPYIRLPGLRCGVVCYFMSSTSLLGYKFLAEVGDMEIARLVTLTNASYPYSTKKRSLSPPGPQKLFSEPLLIVPLLTDTSPPRIFLTR